MTALESVAVPQNHIGDRGKDGPQRILRVREMERSTSLMAFLSLPRHAIKE